MAQHEMTRHETRECAFYILFEMQFQNDTAEELFQIAEEADQKAEEQFEQQYLALAKETVEAAHEAFLYHHE